MLTFLPQLIIGVIDLVAAFLFMFGLQQMSSPVTAPSGIKVAGVGMLVAVVASFLYAFNVDAAAKPFLPVNLALAAVALIVGGGLAWWMPPESPPSVAGSSASSARVTGWPSRPRSKIPAIRSTN